MRESTHYKLNLVEGTDKVNPLVQDVPNYETIDEAMYNNKCASIGIATELRTGTVHALVRQNEDAPMFRFTATSNYASGDTFTVDGVQVSALLVDGTPLSNMAYIIGSEVLCVLKGTLMTVFANRTTSSDSDRLGGELPSHYATDSDLDALEVVVDAHTDQISQINSDLTWKLAGRVKGATIINIPSSFRELHIVIKCPSANESPLYIIDHLVNSVELANLSTTKDNWLIGGGTVTNTNNFRAITKINPAHTTINTANVIVNNVDYLQYTTTEVYYR